jgi:2-pyrone-4,6-dicarboxylate lactonase
MQKYKLFDPNPKTPNPLPPPDSCDSQFHVFAPADKYPIRPGAAYHTPEATIEAALRMHKVLGIQRGLVVQSTAYGTDYRILVDAIAQAGPNYRGCAVIDESVTDKDLQKMHDGGIRGVRFNFLKVLNLVPKPDVFKKMVERVQGLGWFIKIHGSMDDLADVRHMIDPITTNAVIDHFGYVDFAQPTDQKAVRFFQDLLRRGNWWMMLSNGDRWSKTGFPWDDVIPFGRTFIETAPDRMLWSTDWPHPLVTQDMTMKNDGEILELLYRVMPSEEIKKKVLVDNPAKLFGFHA